MKVKKILHIGDIAGGPISLRDFERKKGLKADVVQTSPHNLDYGADYSILITGFNLTSMINCIKLFHLATKYDILFYHKKPLDKFKSFEMLLFKYIMRKKIIIQYHGSDIRGKKQPLLHKIVSDDFLVSTPDLLKYVPKAMLLPTQIHIDDIDYIEYKLHKPIKILHAATNRKIKGTDHIIKVVNNLKEEGFSIDFEFVENTPHKVLIKKIKESDIIIDQILIGCYGTLSVESLAAGKPVISYVRPELYPYDIPHIIADKKTLEEVLREWLNKSEVEFKEKVCVEEILPSKSMILKPE